MDTSLVLLHHSTVSSKPKLKRPSSDPTTRIHNPLDTLLESFLEIIDSSLPNSIDLSFDRIVESRPFDSDKSDLINRALLLGSALTEAAKRSARKCASAHNLAVWALPSDLTIKVFSMLDTQSVCRVAATCVLFRKCASDPLCYAYVDLITTVPKVNNLVVSTMIQRAGKLFKSLKLGVIPDFTKVTSAQALRRLLDMDGYMREGKKTRQGKETNVLTRSCLAPLFADGGAAGTLLRQLHLFNIERVDHTGLTNALSACPTLLDLAIVGIEVELGQTLDTVSTSCPLIERLFFESSNTGRDDSLKVPTCNDLVTNCPHLFSLALRGFKLHDSKLRILVKGIRKLKHVDFSTSYSITGEFLRHVGSGLVGGLVEVMILRDCMHLREAEVTRLLSSILAGRFKHLRHLDISNREGLSSEVDWNRRFTPNLECLGELLEVRPNLSVIAEFPAEGSFVEEVMTSSDANSDFNTPSQTSSRTSDGYGVSSMSEGSYNSDQSSGMEENTVFIHSNREESPDDMGYLF